MWMVSMTKELSVDNLVRNVIETQVVANFILHC